MADQIRSRLLGNPLTRRLLLKSADGATAGGVAGVRASTPAFAQSGGTLTGLFYNTANPWAVTGGGGFPMLVFEPMLAGAPNYSDVTPALAESWVVSDDNLTYTFTLRQDVTWHDGQPFTAADVVWSYTALLHPAISGVLPNALSPILGAQAYKNGEATEIPGLTASDDYTVTITTESTSPTFLQQIATVWILPKRLLESAPPETLFDDPYFQTSLVGTGPFKFKEMQVEQLQTVDRYEGYYRGAPVLDCSSPTPPTTRASGRYIALRFTTP